jgi:hypothetical protein
MLKKEDALKFIKDLEQRGDNGVITDKNEKYLDISVIEHNVSDQTLAELHREKKIKIVEFWNRGHYDYLIKSL